VTLFVKYIDIMLEISTQSILQQGRGAQINTDNPFHQTARGILHAEGIDEFTDPFSDTQFFPEYSKNILNKIKSPDVGMLWSANPYQGCEHGCVYCYARNSHQYWGWSAGIDFESRIMWKPQAAKLLEAAFMHNKWTPQPISLSGNTDCYQPAERKLKITREMLKVCLQFKNPVGIITKNSLVLRDLDILQDLAKDNLVTVMVSMNGVNEKTREKLEPRTATYKKRLETISKLSEHNIPAQVLVAPVIPGLNDHEMPEVIRRSARHGAVNAGYIVLRLNGAVAEIFSDWIYKAFPGCADKVLAQVKELHGGNLQDSRFGTRMKGEGNWSVALNQLFHLTREKYFGNRNHQTLNTSLFRRPGQLRLEF
jgi:DNA repair photolyase